MVEVKIKVEPEHKKDNHLTVFNRFIDHIKTTARDLLRGYSEADIIQEQRLLTGHITEEDRQRFINRRLNSLSAPFPGSPGNVDPLGFTPVAQSLDPRTIEQIRVIANLSPETIDLMIRDNAAADLKRWHQPI